MSEHKSDDNPKPHPPGCQCRLHQMFRRGYEKTAGVYAPAVLAPLLLPPGWWERTWDLVRIHITQMA